jgi:hypothetical protein
LNSLEDRAVNAYYRLVERYPTVATTIIDAEQLVVVGSVGPDGIQYRTCDALTAWMTAAPGVTIESESFQIKRIMVNQKMKIDTELA